ncbi:MAG: hypothetical protein R2711_16420 [Acidimicrobiales bacterium]
MHGAGAAPDHPAASTHGLGCAACSPCAGSDRRRPRLRAIRLAALADAPGDATTTLARAEARSSEHWDEAALANASGGLQATFFAEPADEGGAVADGAEPIGLIGAYANESGS